MKSKKRKFLNELDNSNCGTHPAYSNFTPWFKTLDDMKEYSEELFARLCQCYASYGYLYQWLYGIG